MNYLAINFVYLLHLLNLHNVAANLEGILNLDNGDRNFTKVSLDAESRMFGAYCLDGTAPSIYIRLSEEGSKNWLLKFEGGGACRDNVHPCLDRLGGEYGSSKHLPESGSFESMMYQLSPENNPLFYDFNHVHIPSCDGMWFLGTEKTNRVMDGQKIWLSGANIVTALVYHLKKNYGTGATIGSQLVVAGTSSGLVPAMTHADRFRDEFPLSAVTCLLDSGVNRPTYCPAKILEKNGVLDYKHVTVGQTIADISPLDSDFRLDESKTYRANHVEQSLIIMNSNITADGMHQECVKNVHPKDYWRCVLPLFMIPYQRTPTFILQSQYDSRDIRFLFACSKRMYMLNLIPYKDVVFDEITKYGYESRVVMSKILYGNEEERLIQPYQQRLQTKHHSSHSSTPHRSRSLSLFDKSPKRRGRARPQGQQQQEGQRNLAYAPGDTGSLSEASFSKISTLHGGFYDSCNRHVFKIANYSEDPRTGLTSVQEEYDPNLWSHIATPLPAMQTPTGNIGEHANTGSRSGSSSGSRSGGRGHGKVTMKDSMVIWYIAALQEFGHGALATVEKMRKAGLTELKVNVPSEGRGWFDAGAGYGQGPVYPHLLPHSVSIDELEAAIDELREYVKRLFEVMANNGQDVEEVRETIHYKRFWYAMNDKFVCNECCKNAG